MMKTLSLSKPLEFNLDCEHDVELFIEKHGNTKGRRLANSLGMSGRQSSKIANLFSGYAWNKVTAIELRKNGNIQTAIQYEEVCDRIYSRIPESVRPW